MADTLRNRGEVERADSIEKNLQDLIGKIQIL
jgi:hypothetical protein